MKQDPTTISPPQMKIYFCLLLLCFFNSNKASAQVADSLRLDFRQLGEQDLAEEEKNADPTALFGSRTLGQVEDLPFTIYVITKQQIQDQGFTSLVDVLKSLPGIRVSQPGSALAGETFLMRGLLGNRYTKILINDIPIRPSGTGSMPLGAQLPIQQAERIEITFGPTPGIYGADAMAGTINIITQETQRPFYVQADVSLGLQAYDQLSVTLGGKMGRDKNIINFNIFGSYTEIDERPVLHDNDSLYHPLSYLSNESHLLGIPNYAGTAQDAVIRNFAHSSDAIGARVSYRGFYLDFEQYNRQDHSAVGLNPTVLSLADPVTTTGETITRIAGGWEKKWERWQVRIDGTNLRYQLQPRSSKNHILNELNRGVLAGKDQSLSSQFDDTDFDALANDIYDQYLSSSRYQYAYSEDWYIDPLVSHTLGENLQVTLGANLSQSRVQPFTDYLPFSYFSREGDLRTTAGRSVADLVPEETKFRNIGVYGQLYGTWRKLSGLAVARHDDHSIYGDYLSTTFAVLWDLGEESSLRVNFSRASQTPSLYFQARSYDIITLPDTAFAQLAPSRLQRETNQAFEIGLRLGRFDNVSTDIAYFRTQADQLIGYYETLDIADARLRYSAGYRNDLPTSINMRGFQGRVLVGLPFNTDGHLNFQFARGEEQLAFREEKIEQVRGVAKWTVQINSQTQITKRWFLQSVHTISQPWLSRSWNGLDTSPLEENFIANYYVLDLVLRYQLSREFQGFVQVLNVLDRAYGGISVDRVQDALLYNPQHLRTFRVGLNYNMR